MELLAHPAEERMIRRAEKIVVFNVSPTN